MRAHIDAFMAALSSLGYQRYFVDVPSEPTLPYFLVEMATPSGDGDDLPLCGTAQNVEMTVRLKSIAAVPLGSLSLSGMARDTLTPTRRTEPLTVPSRLAWVSYVRHEADFVTRQVVLAETNRVVSVSVDTYRIQSTPA